MFKSKWMMMQKIKRGFTLLELIVCITILGLVASSLAWNLKGLLDRSRLEHANSKFRLNVEELKMVSLTHQADSGMEFFFKEGSLYYKNYTEAPIKGLSTADHLMGKNYELLLNDKVISGCKLTIFSDGRIDPQGVLKIVPKGALTNK